jgi:hypothetical protein
MHVRRSLGVPRAFPAAVFFALVAALAVASIAARELVPTLQGKAQTIAQAERPPDGDHYLASDVAASVDHHVFYFGLDPVVQEHVRAADVLFLGNSRLMSALRPAVLRPFFASRGLEYYVMAFGFREGDAFPFALLRKFDLRPKLVVVNADGFFGAALSPWADVVQRDTAFAARKFRWESEAAHEVRRVVHQVVPNWFRLLGFPGLAAPRGTISYRSRRDGTSELSPWPEGGEVITEPDLAGPRLGRDERDAAVNFKAELDARGSALVLTFVPTPEPMAGGGPARFADLLGVPLVAPTIVGATSYDHSHLTEASAHDWSKAFVAALDPLLRDLGLATTR